MSVNCPSCKTPMDLGLSRQGFGLHPTCEPLGTHPDVVASEIFTIIADAITNQPRSLQRRIGPSELGIPCDRRIAYKLAGIPEVNDRGVAWKPFIGTAVHEMLADIMARAEVKGMEDGMGQRWHIEEKVPTGLVVNDTDIDGSCDLYDGWTGSVWDWKIVTKNKIRETYRPHGPGEQYRVQAQNYGLGWTRRGYPVRTVGIIFFTRDGEFTDRHVWHEPFDEQVALASHERIRAIATSLDALGPGFTIEAMPMTASYCNFCSWFSKGSDNPARMCAGAPRSEHSASNARPASALHDLIA